MTFRVAFAALIACGVVAGPTVGQPLNSARAHVNWMLKCQGCHRSDAGGSPTTTPEMAGHIARFLAVPGGRDYLVRVPGVATSVLADAELAELMNWTLLRFDAAHVPANFRRYTGPEVGRLRQTPLRTEAYAVRARLVADLDKMREPASRAPPESTGRK
jgi:hypothetical protein